MNAAATPDVIAERQGAAGLVTLNRPKALNALSLGMIRALTATLRGWRHDPAVQVVALRGQGRDGPFGAFCAGGDIRFFHQAAHSGNPELEDFFTEEYTLNHLIHIYPKPIVVFMDGIVMGGGMGLSGHGARHALRIATERTKMAMPETNIGLFPDVGGGWFLARSPGAMGEYLALTGQPFGAEDALANGLADGIVPSSELGALWTSLGQGGDVAGEVQALRQRFASEARGAAPLAAHRERIEACFSRPTVPDIVAALEADGSPWAVETLALLRKRSPLMLHVTLEQVRRARTMSFTAELRMERSLVRRCFWLRPGAASETVEGIRAQAVDKDQAPRWNPARIEDVTPAMVEAFFEPAWPAFAHPLHALAETPGNA